MLFELSTLTLQLTPHFPLVHDVAYVSAQITSWSHHFCTLLSLRAISTTEHL